MVKRDGTQVSLWQRSVNEYRIQNKVNHKEIFDVAIVGGGITGLATANQLQQEGKKCIVLEAWSLGFGSTGGTTAHLNTFFDTPYTTIVNDYGIESARVLSRAAQEASLLVRENIASHNIACDFKETSALIFSQDEKQTKELMEIYKGCKNVGIEASFTNELPVPVHAEEIMQVFRQASFHPLLYIHGLANAFEHAGGNIVQQCVVQSLNEEAIIDIYTTQGLFQAKNLFYATHTPPGVNSLHLRCVPYRSYAMAVRVTNPYPEELIYDMQEPYHYIRTHWSDNIPYLIVGGEDHKTAHEANTEKPFRNLEAYVHKYFEVTDIISRWSSQYYEPVDGLPYIGHYPGHRENIFVATGFGGNGMTYSHIAAMTMRDILFHRNKVYETLFSPMRMKPIAGFKAFVEHNADTIRQFIGKWFASEELSVVADLAPGEGKVVKYNGETMAVSKDLEGRLHAVNPVCTHMGCAVNWNLAEQSWECPCHGARYTNDGKVLNGPSRVNLEQIELRTQGGKTEKQVAASEEV